MAWNKVTKEELKEAGLDVDAFKSAMDKTAKIETIETTVNEVKTTLDSLKGIKDQLTALEGKLREPPKGGQGASGSSGNTGGGNGGGGGSSGENPNPEEEIDWVLDPQKATEQTIRRTVTPLVAATGDMRAQMNYANFKASNPKGFRKYETEIKELWGKQSLAARQNPELVENCYLIVLGKHSEEIQKGGDNFFVEAGGSSTTDGTKGGGENKKAVDILSKDQLDLCSKWGVDPEDYLKELQAGGATSYA